MQRRQLAMLVAMWNVVVPEVLICNLCFARNGDFSFQKALDFLEF